MRRRCGRNSSRDERTGWRGASGQATSEYVMILGMIVVATIGMLGTLMPLTRLVAGLVRRIVLDLSG
jgi:hypothetical protein